MALPDQVDFASAQAMARSLGHAPGRLQAWAPVKRVIDVFVALAGLVVLVPVYVAVGAAVVATSRGPVFFGHDRVGLDGRRFRMWKFRSMYADADERLHADDELYRRYLENDFKLCGHEDPRITPIGNFLRRTSLDELPQLVNVLTGTMSLVGPRPVVPPELARYGGLKDTYLSVRPGITGPWQASGRNDIRYPERAQIDAEYVEQWTPATDLRIVLRTIPVVLRRSGAS